MNLVAVVVQSSYPVCVSTGQHLAPGSVAEIIDNTFNRRLIAEGLLSVIARVPTAREVAASQTRTPTSAKPKPVIIAEPTPKDSE